MLLRLLARWASECEKKASLCSRMWAGIWLTPAGTFFRIFKESRPDVVHLHNPTPTIYAAMAARMAGVPSIVSTRHSLVAPPRRLAVELKYAVAACACDWIVGICDATMNNLKSLHSVPRRKIVRVYNGAVPLKRTAKARLAAEERIHSGLCRPA